MLSWKTQNAEDYRNVFKLAQCAVRTFVSYMLLAERQTAAYPTQILSSGKFRCLLVHFFVSEGAALLLIGAVGTAALPVRGQFPAVCP